MSRLAQRGRRYMGGGSVEYIAFADPVVESICVANWSSDGIGVTYADAAAVTSLNQKFKGNTNIVSFMELEYFTNVTILLDNEFDGCTSLKYIYLKNISNWNTKAQQFRNCDALESIELSEAATSLSRVAFPSCRGLKNLKVSSSFTSFAGGNFNLVWQIDDWDFWPDTLTSIPRTNNIGFRTYIIPKNVTSVESRAFSGHGEHRDATRMQWLAFLPTTPPSFEGNPFYIDYQNSKIYVPDASVNAYKTANNLTSHASRIYPISQMQTDFPNDWTKYSNRFVGLY